MLMRCHTTPTIAAKRLAARRRVRWTGRAAAFGPCLAAAALLIACGSSSQGADPSPSPAATRSPKPAAAFAARSPSPPTPDPTPSPFPWIPGTPWPGRVNMPILMYHHIDNVTPASALDASLTTNDAEFSKQLAYLRCAGYTSVTLQQLFDGIYTGAPLPSKPVVLTFDDGYSDAFTDAFPLLRKYGFGGSFAIVTGFVGQPGYVNWDQVKQMAGSQMEMMSHTVNHADLNRSPDAVVRNELVTSKRALEEALGKPVPFLVYPSGEPFFRGSPERQQQVVAMVREAGYSGALVVRNMLAQDPAAPYALNRIRVSGGVDIRKFAGNMGGPLPETVGC